MPKIAGSVELVAKLRRGIGPKGVDIIEGQLLKSAETVMNSAKQSITDGAVSGAGHVPSKPGEPPNNDTGILAGNIRVSKQGPLHTRVSSEAPYAAIQEFGGTINHPGGTAYFIGEGGMATFVSNDYASGIRGAALPRTAPHNITLPARPYMAPALQKNRADIVRDVAKAVNLANRIK